MIKVRELKALILLSSIVMCSSAMAIRAQKIYATTGTIVGGFGAVSASSGKEAGIPVGLTFMLMGTYTAIDNSAFAANLSNKDAKKYFDETISGVKQYLTAPDSNMNLEVADLLNEFTSNNEVQDEIVNAEEFLSILEEIKLSKQAGVLLNNSELLDGLYDNDANRAIVNNALFFASIGY